MEFRGLGAETGSGKVGAPGVSGVLDSSSTIVRSQSSTKDPSERKDPLDVETLASVVILVDYKFRKFRKGSRKGWTEEENLHGR